MIVAAEIVVPRVVGIVNEDWDNAFHKHLGIQITSEPVGAARRRTDG